MSEMVDRVASAIHSVHGILLPFRAMDDDSKLKQLLRSQARAAIAAMREPTEEMRRALLGDTDELNFDDVWQSIIDAALSEKKDK